MLDRFLKGLGSPAGQDALFLLGATMKDIGAGGTDNFMGAQSYLANQRQKAGDQQAFDDLVSGMMGGQPSPVAGAGGEDVLAGGPRPAGWSVMDGPQNLTGPDLQGNPGEMGGLTPDMRRRLFGYYRRTGNLDGILDLMKPAPVETVEGPDGLYERQAGGWKRVIDYPKKEREAPAGMVRDEAGRLVWEPGYVDAQKALADVRREAIVDRPMPSRARPGGGRSGSAPSGLPSGFTLD